MMAFGITAIAFVGLSAYAIKSGRRFSFMGGFLAIGILTAFLLGLVAIFFSMPMLSLAVSGVFVLLMSGLILYQTGEIVHGGETNYIHATVTLYVASTTCSRACCTCSEWRATTDQAGLSRSTPPRYGRSASGTTTLPSASW